MSNKHTNNYKKLLEAFTNEELHNISQVKRFFEWYEGDVDFRTAVNAGRINADRQKRMKQIGIHFEPREMALLWENPEIITGCNCRTYEEIPKEHAEILKKYPLVELWFRFVLRKERQFQEVCAQRFPVLNTRFENWRNRRIASAQSELGAYNRFIDHPTLAFELCDGCSVQCWFCAFNSKKLQSTLDYKKNKDFFRGIARVCTKIFGGKAAGMALLYYATEPYDNPHYIDYMKDYEDITGSPVCTSTAVGADKKWIDDLLAYYRARTLPWPRLSVLSTKMLYRIHDNHSPDELRDVSLHMQMKNSRREKVSGGRIFSQKDDMRQRDSTNYLQDVVPQGTIACVTGFYVNLVKKNLKLVSPCYTSEKWPYGYRVFDEASFDTVEDFRNNVLNMIEHNMPDAPPAHMPLRLRDDLICKPLANGFDLVSPNQIHHFQNKSVFNALGELLTDKPVSYQEAGDILVERYRQDPFAVQAVLKYLFANGFLDEVGLFV